jgi:nicotinamidase-related amidase
LGARLRELGARYLIATGCTTSVCVESTIGDAMFRDDVCLLLEDCTDQPMFPGVPLASHEASLRVIEAMFGIRLRNIRPRASRGPGRLFVMIRRALGNLASAASAEWICR